MVFDINDFGRETINKIHDCRECFIPKLKRQGSMSKKCKPHVNNVPMFVFCHPILLVSVRASDKVGNDNTLKKNEVLDTPLPNWLGQNEFSSQTDAQNESIEKLQICGARGKST